MLGRKENQTRQGAMNLRGGAGETGRIALFGEAALPWNLKLAAILELEPGVSIGRHDHTGEWELFYLLEGELHGFDMGEEIVLRLGDSTLTGGGQEHLLENRGSTVARVLAVIAKE